MENVPAKLFTTFNKVTYFDEPHKYYVGDKQLISVTTLIDKFTEEFDEEYWSEYKANEFGLPQQEIKNAWKFINKVGVTKGSIIHDYAESLFQNKQFPYPKERVESIFGYDPVYEQYVLTKKHVDTFYRFSIGRLLPIMLELVVYDQEYGIAGMVDILFWNIKAQEFQIWDWKTNKDFTGWDKHIGYNKEEGKVNMLGPLGFLKDNDINHYSLQLGLYKHIIERNTGIKLGKSYLIWVSHLEDRFHAIEILDRSMYIQKMIDAYV